mgnify:CR=1 FL=1
MKTQVKVSGTKEWSRKSVNIMRGCSHGCLPCYAHSIEGRFKRKMDPDWRNEEIVAEWLERAGNGRPTKIMFPTTHDIPPDKIEYCLIALRRMLGRGHTVLIVSKPHIESITRICEEFENRKLQIMFRFTIGSVHNETLRFWEPYAPLFEERMACLQHAFSKGFKTSISCEPLWDENPDAIISAVSPYVTDTIWIGKANRLRQNLRINGHGDPETMRRADEIIRAQNDEHIKALYARLRDNPMIRFKESIKKVVGLALPQEAGMDV